MAKKERAPRTTKTDPNETKAQKFVRLAEKRLTKAVSAIRNIAKLGGPNYERNAAQQKAIVDMLRKEIAAVETALVPHVPGAPREKQTGPVLSLAGLK